MGQTCDEAMSTFYPTLYLIHKLKLAAYKLNC